MARGNIIQGQASGKLGDTVLMVRNGKQVARVYTTSGARSGETASMAARLQRVRFGAASNQWQLYRYICTRMFRKGRNTNQSDYNYFVKRNVENLPYLTKLENADGVCCLMPGQFSEGNLGRIELLYRSAKSSSTQLQYSYISDTINPTSGSVNWSATVGTLKASLRSVYPNARKVTYLIVQVSETSISEGTETFLSQFYQHFPVVFDLYQETTSGENEQTVKQYFTARIANTALTTVINNQENTIISNARIFEIWATSAAEENIVSRLGLLVFATDDYVSDCYTTILPVNGVLTTDGVYSVWGGYRTGDALKVASESYGYQSGVMRDEISAAGNEPAEQAAAYVARLRSIDADEADRVVAELKAAGGAKARTVRKVEESEE